MLDGIGSGPWTAQATGGRATGAAGRTAGPRRAAAPDRRRAERRRSAALGAAAAGAVAVAVGLMAGPRRRRARSTPAGTSTASSRPPTSPPSAATSSPTRARARSSTPRPGACGPTTTASSTTTSPPPPATHNVSTQLVRAVIQVESDFDSLARSSKGAQGLMQLMPYTARELGREQRLRPPAEHLRAACATCASCSTCSGATWPSPPPPTTPGANDVQRYGGVPPFKETRSYVAKIQCLLSGHGQLPSSRPLQRGLIIVRAEREPVARQGAARRGRRGRRSSRRK